MDRCRTYGATEALYSTCRRFTMPIVRTITSAGAASWMSCAVSELRRAREHDGGHALRQGGRQPGPQRGRAVDHAEREYSDQQRELGLDALSQRTQ